LATFGKSHRFIRLILYWLAVTRWISARQRRASFATNRESDCHSTGTPIRESRAPTPLKHLHWRSFTHSFAGVSTYSRGMVRHKGFTSAHFYVVGARICSPIFWSSHGLWRLHWCGNLPFFQIFQIAVPQVEYFFYSSCSAANRFSLHVSFRSFPQSRVWVCLELWRRNSKGNGELRQRSPCPFVLALYVGYVFLREKNIRIPVVKKKGPSLVRKGNGARR